MKSDDLERDLGADLSRALDAASVPGEAPADLAQRLKTNLRREQGLDRLLDGMPEPEIPAGLAERTLSALQLARRSALRSPRRLALVGALATAAAVLVGFGLSWFERAPRSVALPEPELLAVLDVLESWEDLTDPDVVLGSWDAADGWLLDWNQTNQDLNEEETQEN